MYTVILFGALVLSIGIIALGGVIGQQRRGKLRNSFGRTFLFRYCGLLIISGLTYLLLSSLDRLFQIF